MFKSPSSDGLALALRHNLYSETSSKRAVSNITTRVIRNTYVLIS